MRSAGCIGLLVAALCQNVIAQFEDDLHFEMSKALWCLASANQADDTIRAFQEGSRPLPVVTDLCEFHIRTWCRNQFPCTPEKIDICVQIYFHLLPGIGTNNVIAAVNPMDLLCSGGGWHNLKQAYAREVPLVDYLPRETAALLARITTHYRVDHQFTNKIIMRLVADARRQFAEFALQVANSFVGNRLLGLKSLVPASPLLIHWGAPGSGDVTSDLDINLTHPGSGAAVLLFNRMFESRFRHSGLSWYRTAGSHFDLNVYAENFLHPDMYSSSKRGRAMNTLIGETASPNPSYHTFLKAQADSFVWGLVKLLDDIELLNHALSATLSTSIQLESIIPLESSLLEDLPHVDTSKRARLASEMQQRVKLASACNRYKYFMAYEMLAREQGIASDARLHTSFPYPAEHTQTDAPDPKREFENQVLNLVEKELPFVDIPDTLQFVDAKTMLINDFHTLVFQRISAAASILSDRIPSLLRPSAEVLEVELSPDQTSALHLVHMHLRHLSTSCAPEAYATEGAVLTVVGVMQAGWHGIHQHAVPETAPSTPLPLHALHLINALIDQVSFVFKHIAEDVRVVTPHKIMQIFINSAKYLSRIGHILKLLNSVTNTPGILPENLRPRMDLADDHVGYAALRSPPHCADGTHASEICALSPRDIFVFGQFTGAHTMTSGTDESAEGGAPPNSPTFSEAQWLILKALMDNAEGIAQVAKKKGIFHRLKLQRGQPDDLVQYSYFGEVFREVTRAEQFVDYLVNFAVAIRKVLAISLYNVFETSECFFGGWQNKCSPSIIESCRPDKSLSQPLTSMFNVGTDVEIDLQIFELPSVLIRQMHSTITPESTPTGTCPSQVLVRGNPSASNMAACLSLTLEQAIVKANMDQNLHDAFELVWSNAKNRPPSRDVGLRHSRTPTDGHREVFDIAGDKMDEHPCGEETASSLRGIRFEMLTSQN